MLKRFLMLALVSSPIFGIAKTTHPVKKSEEIKIKAVKFIGVKKVPVDELKAVLTNKKSSLFGLVSINGKYRPKELQSDPVRIRDVYYRYGYLDVQISRPKLSIDPATSEATITYRVHEGYPYNISTVRIVKRNDVDTAAIARKLTLRSGNRFNVQKLRDDIRTITLEVGNTGRPFVRVQRTHRQYPHPRQQKNKRFCCTELYRHGSGRSLSHG